MDELTRCMLHYYVTLASALITIVQQKYYSGFHSTSIYKTLAQMKNGLENKKSLMI